MAAADPSKRCGWPNECLAGNLGRPGGAGPNRASDEGPAGIPLVTQPPPGTPRRLLTHCAESIGRRKALAA